MKKFVAILLVLTMIFSLAGCGKKEPKDLVKVGDTTITSDELDAYVKYTALNEGVDIDTCRRYDGTNQTSYART